MKMITKEIQFVIPHKGRLDLLIETLRSIVNQEYDLNKISITVVTQNTNIESIIDRLRDAGENLNKPIINIIYRPETDTISKLRNIGIRSGTSEYIALLDADIHIPPIWLSTMIEEIESNKNVAIVSTLQAPSANATRLEKIRVLMRNNKNLDNIQHLPAGNLFLSRKTFEKTDGFPEHLKTCEDVYFTGQVAKFGKLFITTKIQNIHLGEDKSGYEFFKKEIWRGSANLKSLKGRRIPVKEYPSLLIPIWIIFFLLFILFSLIVQNFTLTFIGVVMFLVPMILYAVRLWVKNRGKAHFITIFNVYFLYHTARAVGVIKGLFSR